MIKFQHHYNYLLHKLVKYFVDLIIYKKIFVYNFFIKNLSLGDTCFSYYSVKLNDVDFNDATFRFACGGAYGNYFSSLIKKYNKKFFFLDIGANIGIFSLIAENNKNCKKIFAIEPSKLIFKRLKNNLSYKKCIIYNLAISKFNGFSNLTLNKAHSGVSRLIKKKEKTNYISEKVVTKNHKFFNMIYDKYNPKNLIVKVDVEGHQFTVIKEIKKSKIYKSISILYIENENDYYSKIKLKKMLTDFKFLKFDQSINFKNKNINMIFFRKKKQ